MQPAPAAPGGGGGRQQQGPQDAQEQHSGSHASGRQRRASVPVSFWQQQQQ
jgi:hypothetical protein